MAAMRSSSKTCSTAVPFPSFNPTTMLFFLPAKASVATSVLVCVAPSLKLLT